MISVSRRREPWEGSGAVEASGWFCEASCSLHSQGLGGDGNAVWQAAS